uniref:Uncharacterized protein n=1 Tax=Denticeps clupeoides TaxID=299321 RepID=A0AAY4D8S4_9TELE
MPIYFLFLILFQLLWLYTAALWLQYSLCLLYSESERQFQVFDPYFMMDFCCSAMYSLNLFFCLRFAGQTDWFRPNGRGRFSYDFMNYPDTLIEEVDMSGTAINCEGLDNLVFEYQKLKTFSVVDM